ncbi:MAG: proteasome subunit alpha, partial [Candidatus Thorarchaeota archaeon]
LLVAGVDDHGPQLYTTDPSGSFWGWKAAAIGKEADVVRDFFAEKYKDTINLDGALELALEGLLKVTDKADVPPAEKAKTLEIGKIDTKDKTFVPLTQEEVEAVLKARLPA